MGKKVRSYKIRKVGRYNHIVTMPLYAVNYFSNKEVYFHVMENGVLMNNTPPQVKADLENTQKVGEGWNVCHTDNMCYITKDNVYMGYNKCINKYFLQLTEGEPAIYAETIDICLDYLRKNNYHYMIDILKQILSPI